MIADLIGAVIGIALISLIVIPIPLGIYLVFKIKQARKLAGFSTGLRVVVDNSWIL